MRRDRFQESDDTAQDSFLDVIANVVGVLVILVMLVSVSASQGMLASKNNSKEDQLAKLEGSATFQELSLVRSELDTAKRQVLASQRAIQDVTLQAIRINRESATYDQHRNELAMHRAVIEDDLERRRSQLDSRRQSEFDVQRKLMESQLKLDEMTQEQLTLATAPGVVEEVESVPTPLAKTVDQPAIHLRVRHGLVSIVPLEELLREVESRVDEIRRRLQTRDEVIETIGPLNSYRLKYTVTKHVSARSVGGPRAGQPQSTVHEQYAQILPTAEKIGQNVEQALMPGSALHAHLRSLQRQAPPVVVWLYTDSFNEFRPIKRALWEMGFSLAVRPMQPGAQIGASPHGTKSSAQ